MPAKGKRVASRQAQLNRRRRRQGRAAEAGAPVGVAAEGSTTATSVAPPASSPSTGIEQEVAVAAPQAQPAVTPSTSVERAPGQGRPVQGLAYNHLASELRRILILAGVVTAVLIGVTFAV